MTNGYDLPVLLRSYMGFGFSIADEYTTVDAELMTLDGRVVPLPGAVYLMGAGRVTLLGFRRRS